MKSTYIPLLIMKVLVLPRGSATNEKKKNENENETAKRRMGMGNGPRSRCECVGFLFTEKVDGFGRLPLQT